MADDITEIDLKDIYDSAETNKKPVLDRAELCADVTIPYVINTDGRKESDDLERNYVQSLGAKLVNSLTGKFMLSILPPNQPFFKLQPEREALEAVSDGDAAKADEARKILSMRENDIMNNIEKRGIRPDLYTAMRLLIITGNALLLPREETKGYRVIDIANYAVIRDGEGNLIKLVLKEMLTYGTLTEDQKTVLTIESKNDEDEVELYSGWILDEDGSYTYLQSIGDDIVGKEETINKDELPFILLRWTKLDGEDYGRGYVEEYLGDFISYRNMRDVLVKGSMVMTKILFMMKPNAFTDAKDIQDAENGAFINGQEKDIDILQIGKSQDFSIAFKVHDDLKRTLSEAFLQGSNAVRDAERVTTREIQMIAEELSQSFGGIYANIAEDIQLPLIHAELREMKIDLGDDVTPVVVTGVDALGRNQELGKINAMLSEFANLGAVVGHEKVAETLNVDAIAHAIVNNVGVAGAEYINSVVKKQVNEQDEIAKAEAVTEATTPNQPQQPQ